MKTPAFNDIENEFIFWNVFSGPFPNYLQVSLADGREIASKSGKQRVFHFRII